MEPYDLGVSAMISGLLWKIVPVMVVVILIATLPVFLRRFFPKLSDDLDDSDDGKNRELSDELLGKKNLPPACPRCGSAMVLRKVIRGPQAGLRLWGCKRYPECRGVLPFDPK